MADDDDAGNAAAAAIQGLTRPSRYITACGHLWKRRGALTASLTTNWVERLVVLNDVALFLFEMGGVVSGAQQYRVDLRHVRSIRMVEVSGGPSVTVDELERYGPKYQLEIAHIM